MSSRPTLPRAVRVPGPSGLAIASLVFGILACVSSPLLVGALFGFAGLAFAALDLARRPSGRAMASWAVALSVLGVLASVGAGTLYYHWYRAAFSETRSMWVGRGFTRDIPGWQDVAVPPLDLTTIDGETIRLSDLKGRPVVLNFWATWCGPCRQEIPHLNRLARESHAGLVVIGVSDESEETLRSFGRKERLAYPVVSAGDLPPPFDGVRAFPTTAFIDRQGIIRKAVIGYQDYETLKARALTP